MTDDASGEVQAVEARTRFGQIADIARAGLRIFALTHFVVDFLIGGALAIACFYIAYEGVWWRGMLAAFVGLAAAFVTGFILAAKLAVFTSAIHASARLRLGRDILQSLFSRFSPDFLASKSITFDELQGKLAQASTGFTPGAGTLSSLGSAIANRIGRLIGWAVTRTVMRHARSIADSSGQIEMHTLRDHLADEIDGRIVEYLQDYLRKLVIRVSLLAIAGACLVAYAIRQIPASAAQ